MSNDTRRLTDPDTGEVVVFHRGAFVALITGILVEYAHRSPAEAERLVAEHPLFSEPVSGVAGAVFFSHEHEYHWAMLIAHGDGYWRRGIASEPPAGYDAWERAFLARRGLPANAFEWVSTLDGTPLHPAADDEDPPILDA